MIVDLLITFCVGGFAAALTLSGVMHHADGQVLTRTHRRAVTAGWLLVVAWCVKVAVTLLML